MKRILRPASLATLFTIQVLSTADPANPIASRTTAELHPDFDISLFAAEPDVADPVAIAFDEAGRAYVAEMRDYPTGFGSDHKPGGTIRLLEDLDGDGKADRSTIFARDLSYPTSVAVHNGGVFVTAPPRILFLKDTNGDRVADVRQVIFEGFVLGVTDSNVNGLRWGLDNRIHGANGGNNGTIRSPLKPGWSQSIRDLDFSFEPSGFDFTTTFTTGAGFGIVFDDWGRSFTTYNINHVQQRILPVRYRDRLPGLAAGELTTSISDHGEAARIHPVAPAETRVNHPEQAGHFSSAGGVGILAHQGLPGNLPGSFLVCDVVGNLVHRDLLVENGPILRATRAPEERMSEFFASRDPHFRPVAVELGPDDALYLLDMQRNVIEHPDYIPKKVRDKMNLRAGEDRGRIYRLVSKSIPPRAIRTDLSRSSVEIRVSHLADPNKWHRDTAQRLLVQSGSPAAVEPLRRLFRETTKPVAQVHVLWTLHGLGQLRDSDILMGLNSRHPGVVENAIRLAEPRIRTSPLLADSLIGLSTQTNNRIRFQTALSLGELDTPQAAMALREIYAASSESTWNRLAVLCSLREDPVLLAQWMLTRPHKIEDSTLEKILRELADLAAGRGLSGSGLSDWLKLSSETSKHPALALAVLEGLFSGLARTTNLVQIPDTARQRIHDCLNDDSPRLIAVAWNLANRLQFPVSGIQEKIMTAAAASVSNTALSPGSRSDWIKVLGLGDIGKTLAHFEGILAANPVAEVQKAVLASLQPHRDPGVADLLLRHYRRLSPQARETALYLLLRQRTFHGPLIAAIETGSLKLGELNLDLEQRRRLLRNSTADIQVRASKLFGDEEYSNRKSIVEDWLAKLPATGDSARGAILFERTCASCHQAAGRGSTVGPDMTDLSHRSVEDLASNILDPNMAIQPTYMAYTAELTDGESETGILESESPSSIVLLQAQGRRQTIPRQRLRTLQSSGSSLMPEGLEAGLTPADLRDLIAFLQDRKKSPKPGE